MTTNRPPNFFDASTSGLLIIGGPCVIESQELCLTVASRLKTYCDRLGFRFVFKASFDKANRSANSSFRGPGMDDGLAVLNRVKEELGVPVLTDIHEAAQAAAAAEVVDVLQIPAFLARQTDLLLAAGLTGRWINVKKGQFMAPTEMANAVAKIKSTGNDRIMLTERGTFFGYNRLVNDFTGLPIMKETGCPVIFDITHSTQQPAGLGTQSGGNPKFSPLLARAAIVAGVDGIFLETHPDPASAKSDAASMLSLDSILPLLEQMRQLVDLRKNWAF
jgi:2-dehydro-3-deoxyphosphooctonate aldolase (KDO 8-P synthase)